MSAYTYVLTLQDTSTNRIHTSVGTISARTGESRYTVIQELCSATTAKYRLSPTSPIIFFSLEKDTL